MNKRKKPPIRTDPTENADQAELAAFKNDMAAISTGVIDERLARADDDYHGDPKLAREAWERDKAYEEAENAATTEIDRRAALLGEAYPFERKGSRLNYRPSDTGLYEYMLCLSLVGEYSTGRHAIATRVFEAVSCVIAEAYLGEDAQSYRMGWPRKKGGPTTFKQAVEELRLLSGNHPGDWKWGPKELNDPDPSPAFVKEQGLDVVAWKRSVDGRAGQLYLLGQCACGKGWDKDIKLQDLNLATLKEWISEISGVHPVRAIFTPRHAMDDRIPFLSRHGGVVFDRVRITLLGSRGAPQAAIKRRPKTLPRLTSMCLA